MRVDTTEGKALLIFHHLTQKSPQFLYQNTLFLPPSQQRSRCTFSNLDSYSHHSGYLVPLSSCRLCANHPPIQLTRCPHGCPRKQKMSARKSSPHCGKLSSNGRNDAYVPSSSLQSSLYQVVSLPGQSSAVDSNLPVSSHSILLRNIRHSLPRFFRITIIMELYNQQNLRFYIYLTNLYSVDYLLVISCSPFGRE